jgi:hypothetical protein
MQLYRPVGLIELQRIYESGMQAVPPRLPEQPIFYPVLNFTYAAQIARDWNTKSHSFAGYVTEFMVNDPYLSQFERRIVGGRIHEELWIPAEQLAEFNRHILGPITVQAAYFGPKFQGYVPERFMLKGKNAIDQFVSLARIFDYNRVDFMLEVSANNLAVFLHYPFWQQYDFSTAEFLPEEKEQALIAIAAAWQRAYPHISLPKAQ